MNWNRLISCARSDAFVPPLFASLFSGYAGARRHVPGTRSVCGPVGTNADQPLSPAPSVPKARRAARTAQRRWMAGCCALLVYAAAATPLAPALTAFIASLDPSHHVALRCDAHGARVVLHHECANSPTHVHGAVARVLTFFAQRSTEGDPDHRIQFNNSDNTARMQSLRIAPSCDGELVTAPAEPLSLQSQLPRFSQCLEPRPPPGVSGLLLSVRSTVLLI
jgi:hypothetical protein